MIEVRMSFPQREGISPSTIVNQARRLTSAPQAAPAAGESATA